MKNSEEYGVLSLDISSASTGWCYVVDSKTPIQAFGTITMKKGLDNIEKLVIFRERLIHLFDMCKSTHIVIEDQFFGKNVNTLKLLSKFCGVALECSLSVGRIKPHIMSNITTKSYFGVKSKEALYSFVLKEFDVKDDSTWTYKTHNDITDAIAQGICYADTVIGDWVKWHDKGYERLF